MEKYIIKIKKNKKINIIKVIANSKSEAVSQVINNFSNDKIISVKVEPTTGFDNFKKKVTILKNQLFKSAIKPEELAVLYKQMAVMTKAGITITDTLRETSYSIKNKYLKEIVEKSVIKIESGKSLKEALSEYEKDLGRLSVSIISMGEETGNLAESLEYLIKILTEINTNRKKIKKAMRQPLITIGFAMLAMIGLVLLIVPKFENIFAKLGSDLPVPTKILVGMSDILMNYGAFVVGGIVVALFIHNKAKKSVVSYSFYVDKLKFKIPIFGTMIQNGMLARYLMVYNSLSTAGISLKESLDTAFNTVDNDYMRKILSEVSRKLEQGGNIASILKETGFFGSMELKMIETGENTGEINRMIGEVSNSYKAKFDEMVDNLSSYIEPILLILIAVMVTILALGIFMPMWGMGKAAKSKK